MSKDNVFEDIHRLLKEGSFEAALKRIYNAQDRSIKTPFTVDLSHAWYVVGDIFYKTSYLENAARAFRCALDEWPEDAEALWALGDVYSDLGNHKEAERYYRKACAIRPESDDLIYNLANALLDQGKYWDAIDLYEKVIASKSEISKKAKKNLALARSSLKE